MKNLIIIINLFLLISCTPPKFIPKEIPIIQFEKTPSYELDLSSIIQPENPIHIRKY